ncbi:MAG: hypothetical protein GY832_31065 [Chloroflexi bacterium]|nr:hypothetical protein [Chloroflexota bacterium]
MRKQILEKIRSVRKTLETLEKNIEKVREDPAISEFDQDEAREVYNALYRAAIEMQEAEEAMEYLV